MRPYGHVISVGTWLDIHVKYRSDCMARVAPGCYGHLRLDTLFIVSDEINSDESASNMISDLYGTKV